MSAPEEKSYEGVGVKTGDVLAGKYRVDRVIGAGGMGVVVAATHTVLNDRVALKFLLPHVLESPSVAQRFLREAQAAVRIKSPHVARVTDVGTLDSGSPYMVMEFLEGKDLGDVITDQGPLETEQAVIFALQTCEALGAAHAGHVVHRDIKPANLFITKSADGVPQVKVLDFGISKNTDMTGAALTQTATSMGSPLYMSPEQMRSARDVDARADIWSLGVVIYEMLTGTLPFVADSMPQLCLLIVENEAPPVRAIRPDVSEELAAVVAKCLQKKAIDRYQDVAELAADLAPFGGDQGFASAQRVARILGSAAPVRQGSAPEVRQSAVPKMRGSQTDGKFTTSVSFGKTGGPSETAAPPPQGRAFMPYVAAGAALVAVLGTIAVFRNGGGAPAAQPDALRQPDPVASIVPAASVAKAVDSAPAVTPAPSASADADPTPTAKGRGRVPGPMPSTKKGKPPAGGDSVYDDRK